MSAVSSVNRAQSRQVIQNLWSQNLSLRAWKTSTEQSRTTANVRQESSNTPQKKYEQQKFFWDVVELIAREIFDLYVDISTSITN